MQYRDVEIVYDLGDGISIAVSFILFILIYLFIRDHLFMLYVYTTCAKGRKLNRIEMRNYLKTKLVVGDVAKYLNS